WFLDP
ncbi:hypothetical protein CP02DC16_0726B, partial [Chlamydia psittaci 02DC16]